MTHGEGKRWKELRDGGMVIYPKWFRYIRMENGKIDLLAILILSELLNCHLPREIRDMETGEIIEYQDKIDKDGCKTSYFLYSIYWGCSQKEVKRAIDNLIRLHLIERKFKDVYVPLISEGISTMFLKINLAKLEKISKISKISFYSKEDLK